MQQIYMISVIQVGHEGQACSSVVKVRQQGGGQLRSLAIMVA